LVRFGGEGILGYARDAEILGHILGENAHGDLAVYGFWVLLEFFRELGHGAGAVMVAHLVSFRSKKEYPAGVFLYAHP
jgi:hypothetical protein